MQSVVNVSYHIDEVEKAAEELVCLPKNFILQANSIGLLYAYSDMDLEALVALVSQKVSFPVLGCTTVATMDSTATHELCATLMVLTADDCTFSTTVSGNITKENIFDEVNTTYLSARASLQEEPKLIFALPAYNLEIMLDEYSTIFNQVAPGIPVLGGLPSYSGEGDTNAIFYRGQLFTQNLVLLCISGNLQPVFEVKNIIGSTMERKRRVTKAEKNVIYTLNDQPFTSYLSELGLHFENMDTLNQTIAFVSNPLLLENVQVAGNSNYSFVRTLHELDYAAGSGTAIGLIPEGATLSICQLNKDDIEKGGAEAMRTLVGKMQQNAGYKYSTVLAVSCIGRLTVMLPKASVEGDGIRSQLPQDIAFSGFYSYGELGPLSLSSGAFTNFAHNESLVLCAF